MEEFRQLLISFANGLTSEKDVQQGMEDVIGFFMKYPYLIPNKQQVFCDSDNCAFSDNDKEYSDCGTNCTIESGKCVSYVLDYNGEN